MFKGWCRICFLQSLQHKPVNLWISADKAKPTLHQSGRRSPPSQAINSSLKPKWISHKISNRFHSEALSIIQLLNWKVPQCETRSSSFIDPALQNSSRRQGTQSMLILEENPTTSRETRFKWVLHQEARYPLGKRTTFISEDFLPSACNWGRFFSSQIKRWFHLLVCFVSSQMANTISSLKTWAVR